MRLPGARAAVAQAGGLARVHEDQLGPRPGFGLDGRPRSQAEQAFGLDGRPRSQAEQALGEPAVAALRDPVGVLGAEAIEIRVHGLDRACHGDLARLPEDRIEIEQRRCAGAASVRASVDLPDPELPMITIRIGPAYHARHAFVAAMTLVAYPGIAGRAPAARVAHAGPYAAGPG